MGIKAFPFSDEVEEFIEEHDYVFVVEQNRDAQMRTLLINEYDFDPERLVPVLHYDGSPITARFIRHEIRDWILQISTHARAATVRSQSLYREDFLMSYSVPGFRHPNLPRTSWATPPRTMKAPSRRSAPAAGTIPSARPSSRPASRCPSRRTGSPSCRASAARPRRRPISSATRTASIRSTAACPSVATGANMANRDLLYIGVSGDGDTASIGMGQFVHAVRRNVNMVYICENNGVYGLTKGQDSATTDVGSKSKKGEPNALEPIDLCAIALQLGATFVANSFSGDKEQLVPIIKAAIAHRGFAFINVISPCVTFNNVPGSTKSYDYIRQHMASTNTVDYVPAATRSPPNMSRAPSNGSPCTMAPSSTCTRWIRSSTSTAAAPRSTLMHEYKAEDKVLTGILFIDADSRGNPRRP